MPLFEYTALNPKGDQVKGVAEAANPFGARQKLRDSGVFPVNIREISEENSESKTAGFRLFEKITQGNITLFTRQLATLLNAGLPLVPSLATLSHQAANPQLKKVLVQVKKDVREGNSFVRSLSRFPHIFPVFYVNMIRSGEASGTLHIVLERLADFNEKQQALKMKIRSALAYPVLMSIIGGLVLFFMMTFIVPNITRIFDQMHQRLPWITILIIAVSSFLKAYWWVMVIGGGATFFFLRSFIRTDRGERLWHKWKLRAPLLGPLHQKIAVSRFSRTLGTLLQSGVPLLSALEISRNVINNRIMRDMLKNAEKEVEEGQPLSSPLARSNLFPPMAVEMLAVGEQSGTMEDMLFKIADASDKEVEAGIMVVTSLLEPVMILLMGLVVGFIVVSILLPMFEMNQLVR